MQEQMGEPPPALANMPQLTETQAFYYGQFRRLSRDRGYTDVGPLPLSTFDILVYYKAFGLFAFDDFYEWMVMIDNLYLTAVTEKQKRTQKNAEAQAKRATKGVPRR